jgi:4-nitrophenol 2-monooxygenase / 4-nitrocatechol 4-monooxygenase, reductase component
MRRLTPDEFRDLIGRFASGVTVVTAAYDGRQYGTTASAVTSLSLEPPMLLVALNRESATGQAISSCGHFAVNILGEGQEELAHRFAVKGERKFEGLPQVEGACGAPLLEAALATLECRVTEEVTAGTHTVFLAEVDQGSARDGAPLAYFRGRFGRLDLSPSSE